MVQTLCISFWATPLLLALPVPYPGDTAARGYQETEQPQAPCHPDPVSETGAHVPAEEGLPIPPHLSAQEAIRRLF